MNSPKHCSPDSRVTVGLPNHNSDYGTGTIQLVAVLLTGCITMIQFPEKLKTFLFTTKTKLVWGLTSYPMTWETSPVQGRWSINMTTRLRLEPRLGTHDALPEHLLMSSWHVVQEHRATLQPCVVLHNYPNFWGEGKKNVIVTHSTRCKNALPTFDYHHLMEKFWHMIECLLISFLLWKQQVIKKLVLKHSSKGRLWIACIQATTEGIQVLNAYG